MTKAGQFPTWDRQVVMVAGGGSALLGLVVLVGWYAHNPALIQVLPAFVPMQYNTALCFLLCGIGLLSFTRQRTRTAAACGAAAGAVGLLTLVEYISGLNLGIDQLLMEHYITVETSHPGRMAPNTALCFSLTGTALLVMGGLTQFTRRPQLLGGLGASVFVLGAIAFAGYLSGASTAYGWGQLTRMAVHTAAGFIALGVGILTQACREGMETAMEPTDDPVRQRRRVFVFAVGIMTVVTLTVTLNVVRELRHATVEQRKADLTTFTRGWAALIAAVARFDAVHSEQDHPEGAAAATLSQVAAAQEELGGFWESGEFSLAVREGDQIVYLVGYRHPAQVEVQGTTLSSEVDEPMLRALNGESGTLDIYGHGDEPVIAAYEPIGVYGWGLVARVDLAELQAPYRGMAMLAVGTALVVIVLGALALLMTVDPAIQGMVKRTTELKKEVNERKRAEEALRESEEVFRKMTSSAQDAMLMMDHEGIITFWNEAATRIFGWSREEALGENLHNLLVPQKYHGSFRSGHDEFLRSGTGSAVGKTLELTALRKNRTEFPVELSLAGVKVRSRWHAVGILRDITQRHLAEEELRKLSRAVEQSPETVLITDAHGRIEYVNPKFTALTGYTAAEAIGRSPRILNSGHHSTEFYENLWTTISEGGEWHGEFCNRKKNGELYWEWAAISPVRNAGGEITHFVAVKEDITERKRNERELSEAREAAEAANQAKSEFLANMSHEIRTPMNAILGFSDLLKGSELPPKEKSYLDAIATSGRSLLTLINDILDLSKVEAGKLDLQMESFSISGLLNEIKTAFSQRAEQLGIEILVKIDPDLHTWVYMDEVRLRQILFNIVGNALKFTREGSVTITARGQVDPERSDRLHLILEVADTGIGIPVDQQGKIFELFQQVRGQSTRQYGGTGLGLAISKRLTEMMGGGVFLSSEEGVGSTFRFDFPEVLLTAPEDSDEAEVIHRLDQIQPTTVLYADDEPLNRTLMKGYFDSTDHTLLLAENGKEAVELFEAHHPALILMDIRMPVMDGIEATKRIKALADVPVLAVTASSMKEQRKKFADICDMHVGKPVSVGALAKALKAFLPVIEGIEEVATQTAKPLEEAEEVAAEPVSAEITAHWPELLGQLRGEMEESWPQLRETLNMTEVEEFGQRLQGWAKEHRVQALAQYAACVISQVEEFDIENLPATLGAFSEVVEQFAQQVKDAS